jgi:hypothetical protein
MKRALTVALLSGSLVFLAPESAFAAHNAECPPGATDCPQPTEKAGEGQDPAPRERGPHFDREQNDDDEILF